MKDTVMKTGIRKAAAMASALLMAVSCFVCTLDMGRSSEALADPYYDDSVDIAETDPLSLWTDDAPTKTALTEYVEAVTDKNSPDYIPVNRRVAVFDFDGTLFCETDPNYFDYCLLVYRVLEDPDYKDKATDYEKETAQKIVTQNKTGKSFDDLPTDHGKCIASSFAGMTLDEFDTYVQKFKKTAMPSYKGMKRGDGFYLPMLEIISYLKDNDFNVYVISGTDRLIVRGIFNGTDLGIEPDHLIGSDSTIVSSSQNGADGLEFQIGKDDTLIMGGEFVVKNLKMNKVSVIAKEIGVQPVLSFGNSTGDSSMADYTINNNQYRSLAFMLCCDDIKRENGNIEKANKMYDLCDEHGWIPVSMKNDWTTIYGDGVKYKGAKKAKAA